MNIAAEFMTLIFSAVIVMALVVFFVCVYDFIREKFKR